MQKGFIFPSLYIYLGLGTIILILGMFIKYQSNQLEKCAIFRAETERLGNEAKVKAELTNKRNIKLKERADEDLRKLRSVNNELSKRLRDNAGSSFVPESPSGSRNPELSCFSRAELDGALQRFTRRTAELVIEGTEATIGLDSVKRWANIE